MLGNVSLHPVRSLYVHVPFCAQKCEYCAFYSHPVQGDLVQRYLTALVNELQTRADELRPHTVFFGGGTPSILSLAQWEQILQAFGRLNLLGAAEWTVECNPATISLDKARLLRSYGVNRISMGVQSFDSGLLERLGRVHTREMVFKSFDILRSAGFEDVNLDLMFAIPGQTLEVWRATIDEALALESEHLSCYEVIYEEDTPLFTQLQAGQFEVDEDLACDMYEAFLDTVSQRSFHQYEIANFARGSVQNPGEIPPHACRHNVNYWRGGSFYGLGPSATSYVSGVRTRNWSNTTLYCERIEARKSPAESREQLSPLARAGETAAFGLRMTAGWGFDEFLALTGFDLRDYWAQEMQALVEEGLATLDATRFRLTRRGLRFADTVAEQFIRLDSQTAKPVAAAI
jgi:oxygen-independent coproporphyrinogen-3 oxidase